MRTFILAWNPAFNWFSEEGFLTSMRNLEWGDFDLTFSYEPEARSGDNFYIFRCGTLRDGIVAKGFFLTDPYQRCDGDSNYTMDIRPTFMVAWDHPLVFPQRDVLRKAVPDIVDIKAGACLTVPEGGEESLNAIWDYYTSLFCQRDFGDALAEKSERPVAGIDEAIAIASDAHYDCKDLDGSPAILHALGVGLAGKSEDEIVCGILHDVIEDSGWTPGRIREKGFPEKVIDSLCLLTHRNGVPYMDYIKGIVDSGDPVALSVKLNDLQYILKRDVARGYDNLVRKHTEALEYIYKSI